LPLNMPHQSSTNIYPQSDVKEANIHGFLPDCHGRITSPICSHCGNDEDMTERLLPSRPNCKADCQLYFDESVDVFH